MKSAISQQTALESHSRQAISVSAGATLRMIGHCARHGGALWGAHVAREYLPAGDILLRAMISRLSAEEQNLLLNLTDSVESIAARSRALRGPSEKPAGITTQPGWLQRKHSLQRLATRRPIHSRGRP